MQKYALIVAGGQGLRMQNTIPKQFLEIDGKPIIVHTINQFLKYDDSVKLIVVLPKEQIGTWKLIQKNHFANQSITTTTGGDTRTQSVRFGLECIHNEGLVAIHDAVRPFVSTQIIEDSFNSANKFGSGVAAVPLKDSIREISNGKSKPRNRDNFRLVQTPQTFRVSEIKTAYKITEIDNYTDDSSLYQDSGYNVRLTTGSYNNIKITTKEDLR